MRALVAAIPPGQVSTYGDLAEAAGLSSPRIVGAIMLIIWDVREGERGDNRFGPDPKSGEGMAATVA